MTYDEYTLHFADLITATKLEVSDPAAYAARCVVQGIKAFWGANNWYFKERQYDLVITATADDYDLPSNFETVRISREHSSNQGGRIQFKSKEDFDALVPKLETFSSGNPQIMTIYRDLATEKWKIAFFPRPTAMTIKMSLSLEVGKEPEKACEWIPERFHSGLEAFIAYHIFPPGSKARADAYQEARLELERLQTRNRVSDRQMNFMPDGTNETVEVDRPWA